MDTTGLLDRKMTSRSGRRVALVVLCLAFFMVILDSGVVVVALPSIGRDLRFTPSSLQWVLSAYLLPFGGLLLLGGRAADLLGRRRVFMAGAALFALASLASGLAATSAVLVGARAAQGVAAAAMTPSAMSILMTTFAEGPERNRALGAWAAVGSLGGTAAWILGGPLVSGLGWRWIFFVNIPAGLAVVALSPVLFSESRQPGGPKSIDLPGAVAVTAGLTLAIYAVVEAPSAGWLAPRTLALLALSAVVLVIFAAVERRVPVPLAPARLFRSPPVLGGNLLALAVGMIAFSMPFTLTRFAQQVLGYSPLRFGLAVTIMPAMSVVGAAAGQRLVSRRGPAPVALAGILAMGLGCILLTTISARGSYLTSIFLPLVIYGPGLGAAYVTGSAAALTGVGDADAGLASGLSNAAFQIGGAIGVAVASSVAISTQHGPGPAGLTQAAQTAFWAAASFTLIGLTAAGILARRTRPAAPPPGPAGRQHDPGRYPGRQPEIANDRA